MTKPIGQIKPKKKKKKKKQKETKKERVESPKDREPKTCKERNGRVREKEIQGRRMSEGVRLSLIYSKKAHHTNQIRELRERERCWSKSYSLSLSLSLILKFCCVWEIPVCHDLVYDVPRIFSKKRKEKVNTHRVQILGVLPVLVLDTGTWPKSSCLGNIVQMYMTHMHCIESFFFFFLEKRFHTVHELQQF